MRISKSIFLFLAAISLSGCIIVPYEAPQSDVGSGRAVPAAVPDSIVKGKTTRAEVVQDQGKPDGEGADWLVYSSTSKHSGLGLFFCVAVQNAFGCGDSRRQVWDYRRLVLRFDAAGVVSDAHVDSASCVLWARNLESPVPCLDVRGDDLRREETLASVQEGKQVLATYQNVRWPADQENDCVFYGQLIVAPAALYFVASPDSPFDRNHNRIDPARCPEPDSAVVFDDAEVADLGVVEGMSGGQAVKLSRKDGSHFTYQFLAADSGFDFSSLFRTRHEYDPKVDDATSAHATELADDIKKATGKVPDAFGGLGEPVEGGARTYDHVRWCSGWDPPSMPIVERQTPCEQPKDGYLVLTATGFMFQLADAGDGLKGLVAGQYADMKTAGVRDSGRWGSYSHWVVIETKDGEVDAFDPDDSDRKFEINSVLQAHLPKVP
ncbi:MAG TPA: hypothetical protein VFE25_12995 [Opitutaceae bacterium]|nr:hypothetical protein [Opitutaceae bacterium]